jgi:hypothetical protein
LGTTYPEPIPDNRFYRYKISTNTWEMNSFTLGNNSLAISASNSVPNPNPGTLPINSLNVKRKR